MIHPLVLTIFKKNWCGRLRAKIFTFNSTNVINIPFVFCLLKKKKNPKSWVWSSFLKGLPFWKGFLSETALPDVFPIHNDWYILLVAQDKKLWIHSWLFFQTLPHYLSAIPAAAAAKLCQLCPTLWDPTDGSPPGSRPWDWVKAVSSVNNCTVPPFQKSHLLDNNLEMWQWFINRKKVIFSIYVTFFNWKSISGNFLGW